VLHVPQSKQHLKSQDAKAVMVNARQVLAVEAWVLVVLNMIKAKGERHPSRGHPVTRISCEI
jgi:hypothetical protein